MRYALMTAGLASGMALVIGLGMSQNTQHAGAAASEQQALRNPYANMSPAQRAAATRAFLGLGPAPDKAAAARGAPLFQQNCSFCHGPQARGAEGPSLITSDMVLDDEHGEHLLPFLKQGRPAKGMPSFATMSDDQLKDIAEFLHQQVEDVANRGTYHVLNILVGDAAKGQTYVAEHCMTCHSAETFAHIASQFRSPDQLQRGWIWPTRSVTPGALTVTATVKVPGGDTIEGRVTEVSDFRITLVDSYGQTHVIDRAAGVEVRIKDPLEAHETMLPTLTDEAMHNVTAYLETLK